eukprot:4520977-Lingulodinium_polyedra.AAC.1
MEPPRWPAAPPFGLGWASPLPASQASTRGPAPRFGPATGPSVVGPAAASFARWGREASCVAQG